MVRFLQLYETNLWRQQQERIRFFKVIWASSLSILDVTYCIYLYSEVLLLWRLYDKSATWLTWHGQAGSPVACSFLQWNNDGEIYQLRGGNWNYFIKVKLLLFVCIKKPEEISKYRKQSNCGGSAQSLSKSFKVWFET